MLKKTKYFIPIEIMSNCLRELSDFSKITLNYPTGNFFYDSWIIKDEYKGSIWEEILNSLPFDKGEARIINLTSGTCYFKHADIDDRYHLNLSGDCGYLIDLEDEKLYKLKSDGIWYDMNAGKLHTAISVGQYNRLQIVVRKLLIKNTIIDPIHVSIYSNNENSRFEFDNTISTWLNRANKEGKISNFNLEVSNQKINFIVDKTFLNELREIEINSSLKFQINSQH